MEGYKCERCGHEWIARLKFHPIICPKCKSPYWDKPKKSMHMKGKSVQVVGNHVQVAGRSMQGAGKITENEIIS